MEHREKYLGKEHEEYSNTLAILELKLGNTKKASALMLEALSITEKKLGKTVQKEGINGS